jgi:tetratricopeptide (TPR) repeat protein
MHLQSGITLLKQRKYNEAIRFFLQFLEKHPDTFDALNLLAICYVELEDLDKAITILETARGVSGNDIKNLMNLGICYANTGQFQQALVCFEQSDHLNPKQQEILNALGNTHRLLHQYDVAREKLELVLRLNPKHQNALQNLAWLELSESNEERAASYFQQLIKTQADNPEILRGLGDCFVKKHRYKEAVKLYSQGLKLQPKSSGLLNSLGVLYIKLNQTERGIDFFKRCLNLNPKHIDAQYNLGVSLQQQGELELARKYLESVLKSDPHRYEAYFNLVFLCKKRLIQSELENWQVIYDNNRNSEQSYWLAFALGRCQEQRGQFEKSFAYYQLGRKRLDNIKPYDIKSELLRFNRIKNGKYQRKSLLKSTRKLIFVTGMPRSGTTLSEQILTSHPNVTAYGESGIIGRMAHRIEDLTSRPFYEGVFHLSEIDLAILQKMFDSWQNKCDTDYIVDTTTGNLLYIGFIMVLFNDVKIVCCKRSPMDTCLSIYQHPLTGHNHYANKLFTLANYFKEANELSNHWSGCFEDDYIELLYEQLVSSPDTVIPKLLSSLGLTPNDACLRPEHTKRTVRTPSATAVREPISTTAIGRWHNFESQLQELQKELATLEDSYLKQLLS